MAPPFRLIVGLGNPGREYAQTRHNAGFWWIERLAGALHTSFRSESKFYSQLAAARGVDAGDLRLAMPQTFMNRSGLAVAALVRFFRVAPTELLVAHDELDLKPGVIKLKQGGGNAGHNGLKDIAVALGGSDFWRLRIGIGHPRDGALSEQEVADYVLHPPRAEERPLIDDAIARALAVWPWLASGDTARAMHELHTAPIPPQALEKPAGP
jgi:PTH1 family peptidyl-tRNA hydrolase